MIPPLGKNPVWSIPAAAIPALLATILVFMDQQITALIVNRREHKLKVRHTCSFSLCVSQDSMCLMSACVLWGVGYLSVKYQGCVYLGSIQNKNAWNNASKRLFGSYSHSEIRGFPFWLFFSQEQNGQNIFRIIFLFQNIPNECALRFGDGAAGWGRMPMCVDPSQINNSGSYMYVKDLKKKKIVNHMIESMC